MKVVAHSLVSLRKALFAEFGIKICRSYLETILKNRFYVGYFLWQGMEYKGSHEPLIDANLFERVQQVFTGRNKSKHSKHMFAFAGLLRCAHDDCTVTAELHKGKNLRTREQGDFLYLAGNHAERGQLLRMVLSNCITDGATITPTYRKPFDRISQRVKTEEWSGR